MQPLIDALIQPRTMERLKANQWNLLIRAARQSNVLSRLALAAESMGLTEHLPPKANEALTAASSVFSYHCQRMRWEVNRVEIALRGIDTPVLLMKGAAYEFAELPPARGRIAADLDIMVPEHKLAAVEAALLDHGWYHLQQDDYDQHYFRSWMHELPPLVHGIRGTVLDVHHGILPRTSRLKPDSSLLWKQAQPVGGTNFLVLAPHDMVLHSAAHAFHDGELRLALRDLVDVHDLLSHFGERPEFWEGLFARADQLDLTRPLVYALIYSRKILRSSIPSDVCAQITRFAPPRLVGWLMDRLVPQVLLPNHPDRRPPLRGHATLLLYIRSHWLKMPPLLLTAHLLRKAHKRTASGQQTA